MTDHNSTGRVPLNRVILIILDGVGIGHLPDAEAYGDVGSHSLRHCAEAVGTLRLPNLEAMGLGCVDAIPGVEPVTAPTAGYGKMAERSAGKDTSTGHWEIAGLILSRAFPTYPEGFPEEILRPFSEAIGRGVLGNVAASGTEIIERLGREHMETGRPIVYTSADSVFQIATHVDVIPLESLYEMCEVASRITKPLKICRVIARPFHGEPGSFERLPDRRDYSLEPLGATVVDTLVEKGVLVRGVGKVDDIFGGRGVSPCIHTKDNADGMKRILEACAEMDRGLLFANLIDFDMRFGHRRNPEGYAGALREFDAFLPELTSTMDERDLLIITADHGNDPTWPGTDHTREHVPLIAWRPGMSGGIDLGVRETFADVGATLSEALSVPPPQAGTSFLPLLID